KACVLPENPASYRVVRTKSYLFNKADFYLFRTLNEAREITERWLIEYNNERPHESLNNLTPEEYRLMAEKPELSKSAWN
ncbi:integrase core domain-containing protein, partial [Klebsiella pneumoniae]|uniref:integrase core domain-containing protein n=1 Tax=Klebsiella pneumoniae TaxID=573 RepID=UPI00384FB559